MGKFSVLILVIIVILAIAIVIIGSDFLLLWLPLEHTDQYPSKVAALFMALTALATLGVAFAAFRTIEHINDQEKRARKERKLITIIEWANGVAKCETAVPLPPLPIEELVKSAPTLGKNKVDAIIEYRNRNAGINLVMRYQNLDAMGKRIILIAKTLDKQFSCNLGSLAQKTAKKLEAHVKLGYNYFGEKITEDVYKKHWKSLVKSAMALAEKAEEVAD